MKMNKMEVLTGSSETALNSTIPKDARLPLTKHFVVDHKHDSAPSYSFGKDKLNRRMYFSWTTKMVENFRETCK